MMKFPAESPTPKAQPSAKIDALIKRVPVHINKIVDKELESSSVLPTEGLHTFIDFVVEEDGHYHLSTQLGVQNTSDRAIVVDFLQFGVCEESMSDFSEQISSIIVNSPCNSGYILSNTLSTIMHLKKDVAYRGWLHFASDCNELFRYEKGLSHMRLYKL